MGVPALFRWLSKKYPRIVSAVEEEEPRKVPRAVGDDGQEVEEELPIDMSGPNPNGEEYDNLYLDMNGIVHPCTHPEGKPAPETEEEMMLEIFSYTERVVNMVRPRKLLMMAIDGVAPRAKMNQQRSRRFRAVQEAKEKEEEKAKALEEWKSMGLPISDDGAESKKAWDSNAITPGTPFMDLLASSLRYWVAKKLNTDPGWKNLQVIISDASVPGEGEHKIMDFIRRQRAHPEHDANTRHVIYGLDADLIMLSLATHEPYFKVLREDVFAQETRARNCHRCGREGHIAANCIGEPKEKAGKHDDVGAKPPERKPFIFLDVVALREYLEVELDIPGLPFKFDLERAIDDWVFLIFFVGNDFLPHLPSLEIREGAIDKLIGIWKKELPRMGSYLTNHGKVELQNAQIILEGIAKEEDDIFRKRKETEERQEANSKRRKHEDETRQRREMGLEDDFKFGEHKYTQGMKANGSAPTVAASVTANGEQEKLRAEALAALESGRNEDIIANQRAIRMANLSAAERLKAELKGKENQKAGANGAGKATVVKVEAADQVKSEERASDEAAVTAVKEEDAATVKEEESASAAQADDSTTAPRGQKRSIEEVEGESSIDVGGDAQEVADPVTTTNKERVVNPDGSVEYPDTVMLWEPGYRERYYQQKFNVGLDDVSFRRQVVKSYMEGMSWVLAYYYQGCPSWTWYYPYHFSPFAADFTNLDEFTIEFNEGKPFRPYDQLMGVLPAASRASIPSVFHSLMLDEDSEIIDFYPETFSIDMNGKKMAWQGVALLPFIDEARLLKAINARYDQLSEDEARRNKFGDNALIVAEENKLYDEICALYAKKRSELAEPVPIVPANSGGITGFLKPDPDCVPNSTFVSPLAKIGVADLLNDRSITALYDFPPQTTPHRSVLLKGVNMPPRVLTHEDREWTRRGGSSQRGGGRGGRGGGGRGGGRFSGGSYNHHSIHMDGQNQQRGRGGHGGGGGGRFGGQHRGDGRGPQSTYGEHRPYGAPPQHNAPQNAYGGYAAGGGYGGGPPSQPQPQQQQQQYQQHQAQYQPPPHQQQYGGAAPAYGGGGGGYGGYGQAAAAPAPPAGQYGAAPPAAYGGYGGHGAAGGAAPGGYGGYGAAQPSAPAAPGGYGGYGAAAGGAASGYGGYGGAANGGAGGYGSYGGYGATAQQPAYGGGGNAPAAGYGNGYGAPAQPAQPQYGAYGAPPPAAQHGGGSAPRPMGYRSSGGDGGRGGGSYGRY